MQKAMSALPPIATAKADFRMSALGRYRCAVHAVKGTSQVQASTHHHGQVALRLLSSLDEETPRYEMQGAHKMSHFA